LGAELVSRGKVVDNLKSIALASLHHATVLNLPPGKTPLQQLDPNLLWLVSSTCDNYQVGNAINPTDAGNIQATGKGIRLIGLTYPT
jgi:hypothetical protein